MLINIELICLCELKTLVALAALAATGASFAQVTISGNLTAGYQQSVSNNQPTSTAASGTQVWTQRMQSGLGVDTAEINITAKEDLGSGQSIEAKLGLENVYRGAAQSPATSASNSVAATGFGQGDSTLTYTNNSFGRIQLATKRGAALMSGIPSAGAPTINFDDKLFERRSSSDSVNFATQIGPVVAGFEYGESSAGIGLGAGGAGAATATKQNNATVFGKYSDSGLQVAAYYRTYGNEDTINLDAYYGGISRKNAWGFEAGYDLGSAKVGFGYNLTTASVGPKVENMLAGLSLPLGSLTLGATYGRAVLSGLADAPTTAWTTLGGAGARTAFIQADGTATGWSIGADYALSKRTKVTTNYAAWQRAGYSQAETVFDYAKTDATRATWVGYGAIETQANLLLSHSF